jgi:hypothetical protein
MALVSMHVSVHEQTPRQVRVAGITGESQSASQVMTEHPGPKNDKNAVAACCMYDCMSQALRNITELREPAVQNKQQMCLAILDSLQSPANIYYQE